MLYRRAESLLEMAHIESITPRNESIARGDGHCNRVHALNNGRSRHRFRLNALRQCRRSLTLCQPIDPVIIENIGEIQISPSRVNEMAGADAQPISIATYSHDSQSRVSEASASSNWKHSTVECVKAVRVVKVRSLALASDSREDRHPVRFQLHFQQCHLNRVDDSEISATWTPVVVNLCPVGL